MAYCILGVFRCLRFNFLCTLTKLLTNGCQSILDSPKKAKRNRMDFTEEQKIQKSKLPQKQWVLQCVLCQQNHCKVHLCPMHSKTRSCGLWSLSQSESRRRQQIGSTQRCESLEACPSLSLMDPGVTPHWSCGQDLFTDPHNPVPYSTLPSSLFSVWKPRDCRNGLPGQGGC